MEIKYFKRIEQVEDVISRLPVQSFYLVKGTVNSFIGKKYEVKIYNYDDVVQEMVLRLDYILYHILKLRNLKYNYEVAEGKINIKFYLQNYETIDQQHFSFLLSGIIDLIYGYQNVSFQQKFNISWKFTYPIAVDIHNLHNFIKKCITQVMISHEEISLEPLPTKIRQRIHSIVHHYPEVESSSRGAGEQRYVVIRYKDNNQNKGSVI